MQEAVFITTKLSVLTKKADLSAVPDIFNPNYAIALDEEMEGSFYILKKDTGKSVLKMLDEREYYQIGEAAAVRVRNGYARLLRDVELCEAYRGNDAYRKMLQCFTEDDFSGIILCGMQVNIVNASAFASPQMVQGVVFEAPVLTVTGVRFDGGRVDVSACELYGRVEGRTNLSFEDKEQMARCLIERVTALVKPVGGLICGYLVQGAVWTAVFGRNRYGGRAVLRSISADGGGCQRGACVCVCK